MQVHQDEMWIAISHIQMGSEWECQVHEAESREEAREIAECHLEDLKKTYHWMTFSHRVDTGDTITMAEGNPSSNKIQIRLEKLSDITLD